MRTRPRRNAAIVVLTVATAIASFSCSNDKGNGRDTKSSLGTRPTKRTTLGTDADGNPVTSVASTEPVPAAPALVNTGEDTVAVARSFVAFEQWLLFSRDAARVDDIYDPSCPCSAALKKELSGKVSTTPTTAPISLIRQTNRRTGDEASVYVITDVLGVRKGRIYFLTRTSGLWKIVGTQDLEVPQ